MAFSNEELFHIENEMKAYIDRIRPKQEIRDKIDIAFRIEGQSVYIYEIRPDLKGKIMIHDVGKTTYIRTENVWKIFWMRADLKWHAYEKARTQTIEGFIDIVETDKYGCFWG